MAMQRLSIPAGTPLLIGAPARPMEGHISAGIGALTASIDGIVEAHLPQMFAVNVMEEPAQVLVLLLRPDAEVDEVIEQLGAALSGILPDGVHLDVWPIQTNHSMADDVRRAGCMV